MPYNVFSARESISGWPLLPFNYGKKVPSSIQRKKPMDW